MRFHVKRTLDLVLAIILLVVFLPLMPIIAILIKLDSRGPILHWSNRVGKKNKIFKMPKFRTMRTDTPDVATHLLKDVESYITRIGKILRRTSLDEIPQLWSVLKGDMSFVGPRPALYNQHDLIKMRTDKQLHLLTPGITGWAQINGRDSISLQKKVELDQQYAKSWSLLFDLKVLSLTFVRVISKSHIAH